MHNASSSINTDCTIHMQGVTLMSVMQCTMLALALTLIVLIGSASSLTVVEPSNCTSGKTHLDTALQNIKANEVVQLSAGDHCISTFNTTLESLNNVTITGVGSVTVHCAAGRGLAAFNTKGLVISNITFDGCGADNEAILDFIDKLNDIMYFIFNLSSDGLNNITLLCGHCEDFKLSGVTVNGTLGLGFLGVNLIGDSILEDSVFSYNVPTGCFSLDYNTTGGEHIGGGALLIYADYKDKNYTLADMFKINVTNSQFLYNSFCSTLYVVQYYSDYVDDQISNIFLNGGGGISFKLTQFNFRVDYSVSDSVFRNNTARGGAGASVQVFIGVYNSSIEFSNCDFSRNGLAGDIVEAYDFLSSSAGIEITTDVYHPRIREDRCIFNDNIRPTPILIKNSNFMYNRAFSAAGVGIFSFYSPGQRRQFPHIIKLESCQFIGNYAFSASALFIQEWKYIAAQPGLSVILVNVEIKNNNNFVIEDYSAESLSGIVHVVATNVTLQGNNVISSNTDTSVFLDRSILHIDGGMTLFVNNSAPRGAGIRLESQSLLIVSNNSELNFRNNRASIYGGGIYLNNLNAPISLHINDCPIYFGELSLQCFRDFFQECPDITKLNVSVRFEGNSAQQGNMVYGTTLNTCPWAKQLIHGDENVFEVLYALQQQGLHTPIQFDIAPNSSTVVATNPVSLVIENGTNQTEPIRVVPGRSFTLHAFAQDRFKRLSPAVITSLTDRGGGIDFRNHSFIGDTNYWLLGINEQSSTLNVPVTLYAEPGPDSFNVIFIGVGSYAQNRVKIRLVDCPPGFVYGNESKTCDCDARFNNYSPHILCNKDDTLSVPVDIWIGYRDNENANASGHLVTTNCHFDYCRFGAKNVSLKDIDAQCSDGYNRGGIGCGRCKEGFGLTFGENRCQKCTNFRLFSIIVFVTIGVVLISTLAFLRLSISDGYLNGILFYANVITLFNPIFSVQSDTLQVLLVFFSWLNLNVGFEFCFYEGMTALEQSFLGFVFPLYLYVLIGLIVLVSKYSQRFANFFNEGGYSATKLFATLFVLTYTSILSNCFNILGYNYVRDLDSVSRTVWRVDPNQEYFKGVHAFLCVLAIVIILVYLLPAPFVLVAPSLVLRTPFLKNYKPLYDAFWAPFKPQFRFWIGLRLLLRFFPFLFANFIINPTSVLVLTTFLLSICFVQAVVQPYNGKLQNASDLFLLFDLLIITVGYLHFFTFEFNSRSLSDDLGQIIHNWQSAYYISSVVVVYILLLIFLLARIVNRFTILKFYAWKVLTTIFCCKSVRKWLPEEVHSERQSNRRHNAYGTTSDNPTEPLSVQPDSTTTDYTNRKTPPTFSELREPLLDSCGEAEVLVKHTLN